MKRAVRADTRLRLRGQKTMLREKNLSDAARDYLWRTDLELARLDAVAPLTMPFAQYFLNYAEELKYLDSARRFAIEDGEGKHIGNCMYYDVDEEAGDAELGILIGDRDYWSKGYGRDAVTTLVNYIFSATCLDRIYLRTLQTNVRAQRCFRRCGFVESGHLSRDGYDFMILEMGRSQWQKAAATTQG